MVWVSKYSNPKKSSVSCLCIFVFKLSTIKLIKNNKKIFYLKKKCTNLNCDFSFVEKSKEASWSATEAAILFPFEHRRLHVDRKRSKTTRGLWCVCKMYCPSSHCDDLHKNNYYNMSSVLLMSSTSAFKSMMFFVSWKTKEISVLNRWWNRTDSKLHSHYVTILLTFIKNSLKRCVWQKFIDLF